MKNSGTLITLACLWMVCLLGCSAIPILDNSSLILPGSVVYMDDFSNPESGWPSWTDPNGSFIDYQADGLRILVNQPQIDLFARPGKEFANSRIEVDAVKVGGPDNNYFGIVCRYVNMKNYYAFIITSDGYNGIVKVQNGIFSMLSGLTLEYNQAIRQGENQNHLRADCIDQSLSLWVNDLKSLQVIDANFSSGEIGLTAGSYETAGVDVYFDNFSVSRP